MFGRLGSIVVGALVMGGAAIGCSVQGITAEEETLRDLGEIARAYEVVIAASQRPPRDVSQIEKVLADLHTDGLVADKPADVLTSPRDGQCYVIILGADLGAQNSPEILAYESQGAGGTRYALLMSRDIKQLADDEFAAAPFAMGHKPAASAPATRESGGKQPTAGLSKAGAQ